ncbi:MAG: hypothetical protein HYY43_05455, partial [Deltaproteobacteria bacterium]|nr:hypothetical protein [Deltaproteobacteria bacterium]
SFDSSTGEFNWKPAFGQAGEYNITFRARANGLDDSQVAVVTVKAVDQPPAVDSVDTTGYAAIGRMLIGSYIYYDANGDAEAGTMLKWLASDKEDGSYRSIAEGDNTLQLTDAYAHKWIKFEVTPKNSNAVGSAVESSAVRVRNSEPFAADQEVQITAKDAVKNIKLSGTDDDNDKLLFSISDCDEPRNGTLTEFNEKTGDVTYTPKAAGVSDKFGFSVYDGLEYSGCATVGIISKSQDKEQAGVNKTVSTKENTDYIFKADDFNVSAGENKMAAIKITELEKRGALKLNGTDVTLDQRISKADIDAGKLKFTPAPNVAGKNHATFQFKVFEGANPSEPAHSMTIDVTKVP